MSSAGQSDIFDHWVDTGAVTAAQADAYRVPVTVQTRVVPLLEPIARQVTRYQCPHCSRTGSSRRRIQQHMGNCWRDPANRACKTCAHFARAGASTSIFAPESDDCGAGEDLTINPAGYLPGEQPDGRTYLRVHCPLWRDRISPNPTTGE